MVKWRKSYERVKGQRLFNTTQSVPSKKKRIFAFGFAYRLYDGATHTLTTLHSMFFCEHNSSSEAPMSYLKLFFTMKKGIAAPTIPCLNCREHGKLLGLWEGSLAQAGGPLAWVGRPSEAFSHSSLIQGTMENYRDLQL